MSKPARLVGFVLVLAAGAALAMPVSGPRNRLPSRERRTGQRHPLPPRRHGSEHLGRGAHDDRGSRRPAQLGQLPHMAVYTGHMKDRLTSTSHGGATTHAYGVKVLADSYGMDGNGAASGGVRVRREHSPGGAGGRPGGGHGEQRDDHGAWLRGLRREPPGALRARGDRAADLRVRGRGHPGRGREVSSFPKESRACTVPEPGRTDET